MLRSLIVLSALAPLLISTACSTRCEGEACVVARLDAEAPDPRRDAGLPDAVVDRGDGGSPDANADAAISDPDAEVSPDGSVTPTVSGTLEITVGASGRALYIADAVLPMGGALPLMPGEVYIEQGRIRCVGARGACAGMAAGASEIRGSGVITPGFVDSHNHIAYDWLPEWLSGQVFNDNGEWRDNPGYEAHVQPYNDNKNVREAVCAMVGWGELRSLAHATTTIYGNPQPRTCFRGLARNADLSTGYNGFARDRIRSNALGIGSVNAAGAMSLIDGMNSGDVSAYLIHIAEGKTARSRREFDQLDALGLLREETVIIHGTAMFPEDFVRMATAGAKLVWSPSSNMALYQGTTDVASALAAGIDVALAPDWTVSGSGSVLAELGFARGWLDGNEPNLLSDQDLVEMVTAVPADHMGLRAEVGRLENGLHGDLVWFDIPSGDPFSAVVHARAADVRLVLVEGAPTYGDASALARLPDTPALCHAIDACGRPKRVCGAEPPDGTIVPDALASAITQFYAAGPLALVRCTGP